MPSAKDGVMIILSSPSGAGKTTLVKKLSEIDNFEISISHTTRQPRPNENQNEDYFFVDKLDDKFKDAIISKIPSARLGEPDDIANAVLFLCSNQSSYINGETLHVNGGMYMA